LLTWVGNTKDFLILISTICESIVFVWSYKLLFHNIYVAQSCCVCVYINTRYVVLFPQQYDNSKPFVIWKRKRDFENEKTVNLSWAVWPFTLRDPYYFENLVGFFFGHMVLGVSNSSLRPHQFRVSLCYPHHTK
jgi:hypothetical protein